MTIRPRAAALAWAQAWLQAQRTLTAMFAALERRFQYSRSILPTGRGSQAGPELRNRRTPI